MSAPDQARRGAPRPGSTRSHPEKDDLDRAHHDHEVEESRWVSFNEALELLDFKSEREVVVKAREMLKEMARD